MTRSRRARVQEKDKCVKETIVESTEVQDCPHPETPSPPLSPSAYSNIFDNALPSNSPFDNTGMKEANKALSQLVSGNQPLSTPARNYIRRLARRNEQLRLLNLVLEREKAKLEEELFAEIERENGVQVILKSKLSVTAAEILEAEKKARKNGSKTITI